MNFFLYTQVVENYIEKVNKFKLFKFSWIWTIILIKKYNVDNFLSTINHILEVVLDEIILKSILILIYHFFLFYILVFILYFCSVFLYKYITSGCASSNNAICITNSLKPSQDLNLKVE